MSGNGSQDNEGSLGLLRQGAAELGLTPSPAILGQFALYLEELKRWTARINLTALKTDRDIIIKHFLDSMAVLPWVGQVPSLADLGCGAGFPGLVLKLMQPPMSVTLVESRGKKVAFLEYLVSKLDLSGVNIVQEYLTPRLVRKWGPRFAVVISRAAFPLAQFLMLAAPLLVPGGRLLALKGPHLEAAELRQAEERLKELGLVHLQPQPYVLPISGTPRLLVSAEKLLY